MNEKRLLKIEEIYHRVMDIPVEERSTFLAEACGEDSELLFEVESLISFAEKDSSLIDTPPMDVAAEMLFHDEHTRFIGREIGQYKILSHIGTGGMGEVFLAEDSKLERFAAIKFIKPEIAQMPDHLRRFLQEAKTASALNHPNIITVYEIGDTNGIQYIATEFIEGKTLRTLMKENSLTLPEILDIISQVATAAQSAHSAGIIHRDIKPENIMLRDDKLVKVLDFGLAKLGNRGDTETRREEDEKKDLKITNNSPSPRSSVSASFSLTQSGLMMGTAAYMSPEQARVGEIDKRTDIWSIGVVFYEMLCGQKPFSGETAKEKINAILEKEPEPIGENLPFELKKIIEKTLEKDLDKRFQSAEDFLQAVDDFRSKIIGEDKKLNKSSFSGKQHITSPNEVRNTASAAFAFDSAKPSDHENISSAEFIFTEVRKHKVFSSGIFAVFIFALVIGIYFYLKTNSEPDNSIAVMPFVNASGDPDMEYLSDGISRSLIDSLSKLSGVKVIAGSSTFDYKGKNTPPEEIARELGVKFILNGRIRELGDNLEISAELIDAGDRTLIWSERFNRKKKDIFAVENEISRKIADNLHIHLTDFEQNEFAKKTETDPRAYELLLKGLFYQQKSSPENLEKAVGYFNQAIEIDPNYAEAYAALAHIYLNMGENSFLDPKKAMPKAKAAAQMALELNENLAEVHLTLAGMKRAEWDWSGAEKQFKRALKLNPNLADVYFKYAFFLSTQGKHKEAISAIKKARELDPLKHHINADIAYIYYFARQYEQANMQYEIGRELNPDYGGTFYGLGFISVAQGKYQAAVAHYRKTIEIIGEHTGVKCYLGFALAKSGQTAEAEKILKELETGEKYVSPVELAILYIGLKKREKAISALERAYAVHDSQMQYLGVEPHFDSLRSDQRFIDLMKKVGLEPGNFR